LSAVKKIVILISGRGSNMQSIVRACVAQGWKARVAAVVSNRPDAPGLAFAQARGLQTVVVDHTQFSSRAAFDMALAEAVEQFEPDAVVLAGFMRILTPEFVQRFAGRLVNIHPSLLPAFTGLRTHERALEAGCKLAGATVHFVTAELDHGPIIAQAVVPVLAGDTPEQLAARVLELEHVLYPRAVRWLLHDELQTNPQGVVTHAGGEMQLLISGS
jgi:phosphoribosylglycinamide formyltransferase 1